MGSSPRPPPPPPWVGDFANLRSISLQDWWDRGKELLKRLALQHCSRAHNDRCFPRSVLSALASHLKGKIDDGSVRLLPVNERVLAQLASLDLTEAERARVRSRVK